MRCSQVASVVVVGLLAFAQSADAAPIWDLAGDWSDSSNPNGPWSLTMPSGALFATNVPDWDVGTSVFGSPQPAWAEAPFPRVGHVPMWFKRVSDTSLLDVRLGEIGLHTPSRGRSSAVWTSPTAGIVDVTGGVWQALKNESTQADRQATWTVRLNGALLSTGTVFTADGFTSSSPFDLLSGSGGAPALTGIAVSQGDVIALGLFSPIVGTFVGVDLTITARSPTDPIPEPSTSVLLGAGAAVLAWRRLRRATA